MPESELRAALEGLVALRKHAEEHDPVEIGCYCTDTDTGFGTLVCAWCKADAALTAQRGSEEGAVEAWVRGGAGRTAKTEWLIAAQEWCVVLRREYPYGPRHEVRGDATTLAAATVAALESWEAFEGADEYEESPDA